MEKPTELELFEYLVDLIDWAVFAQYLPEIKERHIQKIERENKGKIDDERRALYKKWLEVYPDASWNDVIEALEKAERKDIALTIKTQEVKDRELTVHQEGDKQQHSTTGVVKGSLSPTGEQNSPVEISSKSPIKREIEELFDKFTMIVVNVQTELWKMAEKDDSLPFRIAAVAREYDIQVALPKSIDQLFNKLKPHYDFIKYQLIAGIIKNTVQKYQDQMTKYADDLECYLESSTLLDIMNDIENKRNPQQNRTEDTCKVTIIVPKIWKGQPFKLIDQVIRFITSAKHIAHINIELGSLKISFLSPISLFLFLFGEATAKIEFMDRIGIIEMYISDCDCDYYIMEPQDEENINYDHSLLEAAEGGYDFDVSVLRKLGANVNCIQTENGHTALTLASQNGHYQVVELLLKEHVDVNHQTQNGGTALMLASQNGHYQVVELLLKEDADANHQNQYGGTALMLASENGHYQVVELLLKEDADANHQNQYGATALTLAKYLPTICNFLIDNPESIPPLATDLNAACIISLDTKQAVTNSHSCHNPTKCAHKLMTDAMITIKQDPGKFDKLHEKLSYHGLKIEKDMKSHCSVNIKPGIKILVVGHTGSGKSSVINEIVAQKIAEVGKPEGQIKHKPEIKEYHCTVGKVPVTILDTAGGFGDPANTDKKTMESLIEIKTADVVLICHRLYGTVNDAELKVLVKNMGNDLMNLCILVFTFGDEYEKRCDHNTGCLMDESRAKIKDELVTQQEKMERQLKNVFNEIGISSSVIIKIPSIITCGVRHENGMMKEVPTSDDWIRDLWELCEARCRPAARSSVRSMKSTIFNTLVVGGVGGGIVGAVIGGVATGMEAGATIGTALLPGVGTVAGAVVGGVILGGIVGAAAAGIVSVVKGKRSDK